MSAAAGKPGRGWPPDYVHDCLDRGGPPPGFIETLHMEGGFSFEDVTFICAAVNDEIDDEVERRVAELRALLGRAWIHVHYGQEHESVLPGDQWMPRCTDDPCPAIRAALASEPQEKPR